MADRNERESVKYDAVTVLIRVLTTRKLREGKTDGAEVTVEQAKVKALEKQLQAENAKIKAKEDQLHVMRTTYAAAKLLVGKEYSNELREIDRTRYHESSCTDICAVAAADSHLRIPRTPDNKVCDRQPMAADDSEVHIRGLMEKRRCLRHEFHGSLPESVAASGEPRN